MCISVVGDDITVMWCKAAVRSDSIPASSPKRRVGVPAAEQQRADEAKGLSLVALRHSTQLCCSCETSFLPPTGIGLRW